MGYVECNCPKCSKKIRESCNAWVYGSPIRNCPKCGSEFFDKRWREVAIDGFDSRANNPKFYVLCFIGFLIFTIACIAVLIEMIKIQGHYPTKLIGCILLGVVGTIGCLIVLLRQITGYEDKMNEKFMEESQKRLRDREYVEKLISYGYSVPDHYRD